MALFVLSLDAIQIEALRSTYSYLTCFLIRNTSWPLILQLLVNLTLDRVTIISCLLSLLWIVCTLSSSSQSAIENSTQKPDRNLAMASSLMPDRNYWLSQNGPTGLTVVKIPNLKKSYGQINSCWVSLLFWNCWWSSLAYSFMWMIATLGFSCLLVRLAGQVFSASQTSSPSRYSMGSC